MRRIRSKKRLVFYVYVYFRPWDGSPCYIGKGCGLRWAQHQAQGENHYNAEFASVFKKAKQMGLSVPVVQIRQGITSAEAEAVEIALIGALRRTVEGGCLVNLTLGGQRGPIGLRHSLESRRQRSVAMRGRKMPQGAIAKTRAAVLGVPKTDEAKAKMRLAKLGKPLTAQHKARVSMGLRAMLASPAGILFREKSGASRRGKPCSAAHKEKLRAARLLVCKRKREKAWPKQQA